jgi:hypothetical protein
VGIDIRKGLQYECIGCGCCALMPSCNTVMDKMSCTHPGAGGGKIDVPLGPLIVVVASFITLYLAVSRPDPLVSDDSARRGAEVNKAQAGSDSNLAPAVQARNHAQTGVSPKKILGVER